MARAVHIDHLILRVNDAHDSCAFYERVLGFVSEGLEGPFSVVRVSETFTLQLAPWGTPGGEHYAFALTPEDFDAVLARIRAEGIEYGGSFDTVGSGDGPGVETGARGPAPTIYFFDPNRHLIEVRRYGEPSR